MYATLLSWPLYSLFWFYGLHIYSMVRSHFTPQLDFEVVCGAVLSGRKLSTQCLHRHQTTGRQSIYEQMCLWDELMYSMITTRNTRQNTKGLEWERDEIEEDEDNTYCCDPEFICNNRICWPDTWLLVTIHSLSCAVVATVPAQHK